MRIPLRITFRHVAPSDAVEAVVRDKASKLDRFADDVIGCHVVIEAPHRRHRQGMLFHVTVDVTLPGREIVVSRDPPEHHAHEDVYVAMRDAFDAVVRRLEDRVRRRRAAVEHQAEPPCGRVRRLFPNAGYGLIETPEAREIYFHRNSVVDGGFDALTIGADVRFVEEQGDEGPQASSVEPLSRGFAGTALTA